MPMSQGLTYCMEGTTLLAAATKVRGVAASVLLMPVHVSLYSCQCVFEREKRADPGAKIFVSLQS